VSQDLLGHGNFDPALEGYYFIDD